MSFNSTDDLDNTFPSKITGGDEQNIADVNAQKELRNRGRVHTEVDEGNSTSNLLVNGGIFYGPWTERKDPELIISPYSDRNFSYYVQFANTQLSMTVGLPAYTDGPASGIDSSIPYTYTAGAITVPRRLVIARQWYRVVIVNDSGSDMAALRFQTSTGKYAPLASKLNTTLAIDADAEVVRSIIAAQTPSGNYTNVRSNNDGDLNVNFPTEIYGKKALSADRLAFGGLSTVSRFSDISAEFSAGVPTGIFNFENTGSGMNGFVDSKSYITTGTTPSSTASYYSNDIIKYRPGHESYFLFTSRWVNAGTTGDEAIIGLFEPNNGYYLGFKNGQFGVGHRRGGVEVSFTTQASFNGDRLDGGADSIFTRDGVPEAFDHTKIYIFEIVFAYLGIGNVDFRIQSPDGNWIVMHTIKLAGLDTKPHSFNPNLPIRGEVLTTSGTEMRIESSSISAGYYGANRDNRIDAGNTTNVLLGIGEQFVGKAVELLDASQVSISMHSDVPSAQLGIEFEYSHDAVDWHTANKYTYEVGSFRRFQYGINARYFRVKYTNGSVAQAHFTLQTLLLAQASRLSIHRLGDNTSADRSVELVKAGITGASPDNVYTNVRTQGKHTANTTHTPLDANGIFRGEWLKWSDEYVKIGISLMSDVGGTLYVDFSEGETVVDGDESSVEASGYYVFDPASVSTLKGHAPVTSNWVRIRYVNGNAAQSHFDLNTYFLTTDPGGTLQDLGLLPTIGTSASVIRSVPALPSGDGVTYKEVPMHPTSGNPKTDVSNIRDDLLLKPLNNASAQQFVIGTVATRIDPTQVDNRRSTMITNDGPSNCSVGFSNAITYASGSIRLIPGATRVMPFGNAVQYWAITEDTGGTQNTYKRSGTTATGTGTTPSNTLTSDNAYGIISAIAQTLAVDGYTAGTTNDLVSVEIGIEANKQSGQFETTIVEEVQAGATAGAGTVSSASLAGGTNQLYVVFITRNSNTNSITQVQAGGVFFSPLQVNKTTSGGKRIDAWYAYGDFTAGIATASMSTSTNAHISVYRISNADPTTPIEDSNSTIGTGTLVSGPALNGTAKGYSLLGVSHEAASGTPGTGYTEDVDLTNGTGSNKDGILTERKALVSTGSEGASYTLASSESWASIGVTIKPAPAINPKIQLSYELSAVAGATSGIVELLSSTDTDYIVDITSDRGWLFGDIVNLKVIATGNTIGGAAANIDHIFVKIVDTTGAVTRLSVVQGGEGVVL